MSVLVTGATGCCRRSPCSVPAVATKKALNHIRAAKAGGDAQVTYGCTALKQEIDDVSTVPIQCLLQRRPATGTIDGRAAIKQQRGSFDIITTAAGTEWPIQIGAGVNQHLGRFDFVRHVPATKD